MSYPGNAMDAEDAVFVKEYHIGDINLLPPWWLFFVPPDRHNLAADRRRD